jgi:hypothetical protein
MMQSRLRWHDLQNTFGEMRAGSLRKGKSESTSETFLAARVVSATPANISENTKKKAGILTLFRVV